MYSLIKTFESVYVRLLKSKCLGGKTMKNKIIIFGILILLVILGSVFATAIPCEDVTIVKEKSEKLMTDMQSQANNPNDPNSKTEKPKKKYTKIIKKGASDTSN